MIKSVDQAVVLVGSAVIGFAFFYLGSYFSIACWLVTFLATNKLTYGLLKNPEEIWYLLLFCLSKTPQIPTGISPEHQYCYKKLTQTSRSFSAVILGLNDELRDALMIFYIVLRALDSIEDDMNPPVQNKIDHLTTFYLHLRETTGWNLIGYGGNQNEKDLLKNFDQVIHTYAKLKPPYQDIIEDITKKMGNGMADFLTRNVVTMEDYNLYCWYVAGLVGEGCSRLFAVSKLEDPSIAKNDHLYKSMGLFLQKTNIIRDYLEDINEKPPRVFYPKAVWGKWAKDIADFKDASNINSALNCLNELITDAMAHASDCLDYLAVLRDPSVFKFCAIPQVMAIATLYECYNNPNVFKGEVKIRKPLAVKMVIQSTSYPRVLAFFLDFVRKFRVAIRPSHPNAQKLTQILNDLEKKITHSLKSKTQNSRT